MNIVYCIDDLSIVGGIERVTTIKANGLSRIPGNKVYIFVVKNYNVMMPFELSPDVHLVDLGVNYSWDPSKHALFNYVNAWKKKKHHRLNLERELENVTPDVVVSIGNSNRHILPSIKNRHWTLLREIHGDRYFHVKHSRSLFQKVLSLAFSFYNDFFCARRCDKVVLLTEGERNDNWRGWKNVTVMPNPVSFKCDTPSGLDEKRVVSVGRLDHMKNFPSLVNVFKKVNVKHPDWILEIYGDGPEMSAIQAQIAHYGLQNVVLMKGFTDNIQNAMTQSSIFAFPSLSEGMPMSLLEAMECGLPVVSYDCPHGPREIISDGSDGYLIPVNDENMMADRICRLIEDDELRKKMGQAAKIKAQSYQIESIIDRWMNLFNELLGRK